MPTDVVLTEDALRDLDGIHAYIAVESGLGRADKIIDGIQAKLLKLARFPLAAEHPPELLEWGIRDFRQSHYKPYRMIYQLHGTQLVMFLIADGRRDMKTLLQRRLLA